MSELVSLTPLQVVISRYDVLCCGMSLGVYCVGNYWMEGVGGEVWTVCGACVRDGGGPSLVSSREGGQLARVGASCERESVCAHYWLPD